MTALKIALDYDMTYDRDVPFWSEFIQLAERHGHDIRIITHRHPELDKITDVAEHIKISYTDGVAKKWYCEHREDLWTPDIWIDDKPKSILENGPLTQAEVEEWRKNKS